MLRWTSKLKAWACVGEAGLNNWIPAVTVDTRLKFEGAVQEKLDSTNASGRGGSHVRFEDRDRDDAPAPPGAGPAPSGADGAAALRRALSRNTIVPQSVYDGGASSSDGGGSAPAGTANGAATPAAGGGGAPSAAAAGGPAGAALSRETTVPRGGAYDSAPAVSASASGAAPAADVPAAVGPSGVEGLRPARSGLPRHPSRDNLPASACSPSAMQAYSRCTPPQSHSHPSLPT